MESRQISAVIDVGVRKDHRVEVRRPAVELLVLCSALRAMPLKEAAVKENSPVANLEQMLTASHFASRTVKRELHVRFLG